MPPSFPTRRYTDLMPLSASPGTTHAGSFQLQRDSAFAKLPALLLRGLRKLATGELRVPSSPSLRLKLTESGYALGDGMRVLSTALRRTLRWQIEKRRPEDLWLLLLSDGTQPLDPAAPRIADCRSEEHTSELQSLLRISYAVLCLTKKKTY